MPSNAMNYRHIIRSICHWRFLKNQSGVIIPLGLASRGQNVRLVGLLANLIIEGANLFLIYKLNDQQNLDDVSSLKKYCIEMDFIRYIKKHFYK